MSHINILGIIITSILLVFKVNYLIRQFQNKDTKNPFKIYKTILGWPIGFVFGVITTLMFYIYDIPGYYIQIVDLVLTLLIISIIDIKWNVIPNYLVITLLLSQIIASFCIAQTFLNLWNVLISALILIILMFVSKISKEQIGMGDVKLITGINLIYGLVFTAYSLIFSMILMLLYSIPLLVLKRIKLKSQIPFAPFYLVGIFAYVIINII